MRSPTAEEFLRVAKEHLDRALTATTEPIDWLDLSLHGFYCLEAAVVAAATHLGLDLRRSHPGKAQASKQLCDAHGFPDVEDLLVGLNTARKAAAYGDVDFPELDAEDIATQLEEYVDAVEKLITERANDDTT